MSARSAIGASFERTMRVTAVIVALAIGAGSVSAQQQPPDRMALVTLYQALDGPNWADNTNWLTQAPISTWFGVTTTQMHGNEYVFTLDLSNNNLSGTLPATFGDGLFGLLDQLILSGNNISGSVTSAVSTTFLPQLKVLKLARNAFTDLNGLSQSETFLNLEVDRNFLTFEDLETYVGQFPMLYAPQNDVGPGGTVVVDAGGNFQLQQQVGGSANQYEWYFNQTQIAGETSNTLARTSVTSAADAGDYFMLVNSTIVSGLTLRTPIFRVTVQDPTVTLTPTSGTFGSVRVGSSSTVSATLQNGGPGTFIPTSFTISGTHSSEFTLIAGNTTDPLAAQQQRDYTVEFKPTGTGNRSATLVIVSNSPDSPHQVPLSGSGTEAGFSAAPSSLVFSATEVGGARTATTTIANTGSATMTLDSYQISGSQQTQDFVILSGDTEVTLAPLETHQVTVEFSPTDRGSRAANLVIQSDAPDSPHTIPAGGMGVAPPFVLAPSSVDFGNVDVGVSRTMDIVVRNESPIDIEIVQLELRSAIDSKAGSFSITGGGDVGTLGSQQEQAVEISFAPTQVGTETVVLAVTGPDAEVQASVQGSGITRLLSVTPTALSFGDVELGNSSVGTVTVENTGSSSVLISGITSAGNGGFQITAGGESGALSPGERRDVSVRFMPNATGSQVATLTVTSDATGSPHTVPLSGTGIQAAATFDPTSLAFGVVVLPGSADQVFRLENSGSAELRVTNIEYAGDAGFALLGQSPTVFRPGEFHDFTVRYTPGDSGTHSGTFAFSTNAPNSPHTVAVSGSAASTTAELSPESIDFGHVRLGATSTLTATFENTGTIPVDLVSVQVAGHSDFQISAGGSAGTLAPGATRSVDLTFAPIEAGDRFGHLTVESNATGSPHQLTLLGTGTTPRLHPSPGGLDFGDREVGTSGDLEVTLNNLGSAPLRIVGFSFIGNSDFSLVGGGGARTLAPAASHVVTLRFSPAAAGQVSAQMEIESDAPGSPHTVSMIGNGIAAELTVDPSTLDFAEVAVGVSSTLEAEIRNSGTADLQVLSVSVSGDDFSLASGGLAITLAPGQSTSATAEFTPTARGTMSGTLEVVSSTGGATVDLAGVGIGPVLQVEPASLSFPGVEVGVHSFLQASLRNTGETEAEVTLAISGSDQGAFGVTAPGTSIGPGNTLVISVGFRPTRVGAHSAVVTISGNAIGGPSQISLAGTGSAPRIITSEPGTITAEAGTEVSLTAELPTTFQPETRELCFRSTGTTAYQCVPLAQAGTTHTGLLPAGIVTVRGLDYFFRFIQGGAVFTDPPTDAETNPYRLRVEVESITSPVPALPRLYGMISVPLVLENPSADAVLQQLGPADPVRWRLLQWNSNDQRYDEHPAQPLTFEPCHALWFISDTERHLPFQQGSTVDVLDPCVLILPGGWSQIGNPFAFPINWADVITTGPLDAPVAYDATIQGQDPYSYGQEVLSPWLGYWVNNPGTSPVQVTFSPVGAASTGASKGGPVASAGGYALRLMASLSAEQLRDSENYLGFLPDASDGYDSTDFAEAPGIGEFVRLSILKHGRRMAGEFQPLSDTGAGWELEVSSSLAKSRLKGGKLIRVELEALGNAPDGFEVFVLDRDRNRRIPVTGSGFDVYLTQSHPTRRLTLLLGTSDFALENGDEVPLVPQEVSLSTSYPNPAWSRTRIPYQLSEPERVVLTIFDPLGRRIRTLINDEVDAGWHEAEWDGRDASGRQLASGLYLIRLDTGSSSFTRHIVLLRR